MCIDESTIQYCKRELASCTGELQEQRVVRIWNLHENTKSVAKPGPENDNVSPEDNKHQQCSIKFKRIDPVNG